MNNNYFTLYLGKINRKFMFIYLIMMLFATNVEASSAGDDAIYEPMYIVDMPNAGVLKEKHISFSALAYTEGGVMLNLNAAFFKNFNVSISYGASRIIGSGTPVGQKFPGVSLKYRIFDEKESMPAIALGVSTQGRGNWIKSLERFETLSPGVYVAVSKNFNWGLGDLAFHGGLGYSLEPVPNKRLPNAWFGVEQNIGGEFSIVSELNLIIDSREYDISSDAPLFNLGLKWSASEELTLQLQFRNVFSSYKTYNEFTRYLGIDFVTPF